MKKVINVLIYLCLICNTNAQVPQGINYQAVARNTQGLLIPDQAVGVRFTIIDGNVNGTISYQETHAAQTNNFGLFTLVIGKGLPVTGTFAGINWATGTDKFLKVEIAPSGGTNYQLQGTTQLMSVPFSLYAEKTKLLSGNNTITITNGNTITGNYQAANNTLLINGNTIAGNYQAANNTLLINGNTIAGNYQAANNTLLINGNTIAGNYQAANNTLLINGNTIAGNYLAANNTLLINGNTIAGNYQAANNTLLINGNTIAGNYQAGTGISILGNTISTNGTGGSSQWINDTYGIYYQNALGGIGVGGNSESNTALAVTQKATGGFSAAASYRSNDTWHTVIRIDNTSTATPGSYALTLAGSANGAMPPRSFGLYNAYADRFIWLTDGTNNGYLGIGSYSGVASTPKSRLHIFSGDVNIDQVGSGIIIKSPNGQCWKITIDNLGNLVRTAIVCP
jgi:carbonic anhydrase